MIVWVAGALPPVTQVGAHTSAQPPRPRPRRHTECLLSRQCAQPQCAPGTTPSAHIHGRWDTVDSPPVVENMLPDVRFPTVCALAPFLHHALRAGLQHCGSALRGLLLLQSMLLMLLMLLKQHPAAGRLVFANQQTHAKVHSHAGLFCRLPVFFDRRCVRP